MSSASSAAFHAVAVKAPGFGDRRKACSRDIAILTGASDYRGAGPQAGERSSASSGKARRVVIDKDATTIIDGNGRLTRSGAESSS
jgi:chaperonin GroEL